MKKREKWGNISASLDSQNAREKDTKPFPASDSWDNAWKSMEKNSKAKRKTTMCRESLTQRVNPLGPVTFLNIREQLAGESLKVLSLPFFFCCYSMWIIFHSFISMTDTFHRLTNSAFTGYKLFHTGHSKVVSFNVLPGSFCYVTPVSIIL